MILRRTPHLFNQMQQLWYMVSMLTKHQLVGSVVPVFVFARHLQLLLSDWMAAQRRGPLRLWHQPAGTKDCEICHCQGKLQLVRSCQFYITAASNYAMCQHCCYLWCYVQDTFQTGRSGPGSHTTSHLVQDVLILATNRATLDFSVSGQHPIRWFVPSVDQDDVATGGTYVLNVPRSSLNVCSPF